jgi:hypothetical protein
MPPRLAVAAVLAGVGVAAGAYYLWPKGRDVPACAPAHVSEAAREALASIPRVFRRIYPSSTSSSGQVVVSRADTAPCAQP